MKPHFIIILLTFLIQQSNAQTARPFSQSGFIEPYRLEVTMNKTSNLVFPAAITAIDRGSQDILVQKAAGVENILRIKADVKDFSETSLSVITSDGKLYSFLVSYVSEPAYLNVDIAAAAQYKMHQSIAEPSLADRFRLAAAAIEKARVPLFTRTCIAGNMVMQLSGLFINGGILYARLRFINQSNIAYNAEQLRFYVRDRKLARRTAAQEIEKTPVYLSQDSVSVAANSEKTIVAAFNVFTIPDQKYFTVEAFEKDGGRHLRIKIGNSQLLKARLLKE
jgi:conjugative transposon TraN protein